MNKAWWKEGIVYQIYPRSFNDSNGDGIGDIRGIMEKMDYISSLGIDVIWLNPIYNSPNYDNGYDISDYYGIMEDFGTLEDFKNLLDNCHKRGIKLIMDLVVNHSSDQHPWFIESRKSPENPKRNYYIWHPGKEGEKPNNWKACFGGDSWHWDPETKEYYLHLFTPQQPDLNWDYEPLRKEVYGMMNWWLDLGIDGFRMDVITYISKPEDFRDIDEGTGFRNGPYVNGRHQHTYLQEMYSEVFEGRDVFTVGECPGIPSDKAMDFVNDDRKELSMLFQFDHMGVDRDNLNKWKGRKFSLCEYKNIVHEWYEALKDGGWNCNYLMNHDQPRSVSRFGSDGEYRVHSAKMLLTHILTLCGTPYIYQGEELGLVNPAFPDISFYRDVDTLNFWNSLESNAEREAGMAMINRFSRDNSRTPIPWSAEKNGGFTKGDSPWIPLNPDYKTVNAVNAESDKDSVLHYFRKLTEFRRNNIPVLIYGSFSILMKDHPDVFVYLRENEEQSLLIACNFSSLEQALDIELPGTPVKLISNYDSCQPGVLKPWEASIWDVTK